MFLPEWKEHTFDVRKCSVRFRNVRCYECGESDHQVRDCHEAVCYSCGERGHTKIDCEHEHRGKTKYMCFKRRWGETSLDFTPSVKHVRFNE